MLRSVPTRPHMWCQKRITNQDLLVRFGDGKHRFYLESVCGARVVEGDVCDHCAHLTCQTRTQDVRTFPHGIVSDKYTKESHIYDSPWYHAKVKAYGAPTAEVLEFAMEAQKRARAGRKTAKVNDLLTTPEAQTKPKKRVVRTISPTSSTSPTPPQPSVLEQLATPSTIQVITRIPSGSILVETTDTPLQVEEVIRRSFKPFTHGTIRFWRESSTDKLYSRLADGGKGDYVGEWDGENIIECESDSD